MVNTVQLKKQLDDERESFDNAIKNRDSQIAHLHSINKRLSASLNIWTWVAAMGWTILVFVIFCWITIK